MILLKMKYILYIWSHFIFKNMLKKNNMDTEVVMQYLKFIVKDNNIMTS